MPIWAINIFRFKTNTNSATAFMYFLLASQPNLPVMEVIVRHIEDALFAKVLEVSKP